MMIRKIAEITAKSAFLVFKYETIDKISINPPKTRTKTTKKYITASDNIESPLNHFQIDGNYQYK